jgi:hypothetical protein
MRMKLWKSLGFICLSAGLAACGGGGGGVNVVTPPTVTTTATVQTTATGATTTKTTVTVANCAFDIPANTTLTSADGSPVSGAVKVNACYGTSSTTMPAVAQSIPSNETLKAYLDIVMTNGDKTVKNINPPIPVSVAVSLPNGTTVDLYSHGAEAGSTWVKEGTATVSNGSVSFQISHFSVYAIFQQNLTGLTGGSNGGVTQQ